MECCLLYREAQKCFCGASNCRGVIGGVKTQPQQTKKRTLSAEELEKKRQELFEDEGVSDVSFSTPILNFVSCVKAVYARHACKWVLLIDLREYWVVVHACVRGKGV